MQAVVLVLIALMRAPSRPPGTGGQDDAREVLSAPRVAPPSSFALPTPGARHLAPPPLTLPGLGSAPPPLPASLPHHEQTRYDVRYGILGSIGELSLSAGGVIVERDGSPIVKVHGAGNGAILGLGGMEHRLDADFDPRTLSSRRWVVARRKRGGDAQDETVDRGERVRRDEIQLQRRQPGRPDERFTLTLVVSTSDPLGMLWRLRTAPPPLGSSQTSQVFDGLALWRVRTTTVATDDRVPETGAVAIRLQGEWSPIFYSGDLDPGRTARRFTLWLAPTSSHLPLRMEVPVGPGDLVLTLLDSRKT
jgi:hypothetical protein